MLTQRLLANNLTYSVHSEEVILNLDIAVPLGLIISELITNSVQHAFEGVEKPDISIYLTSDAEGYELLVKDNGKGLPPDFDLINQGSLGTEIIAALTEQISAEISFCNNEGAEFKILFNDIPVELA